MRVGDQPRDIVGRARRCDRKGVRSIHVGLGADGGHARKVLATVPGAGELGAALDRQVLALDLEQRDVAARIGTNQFGFQLAAIGQTHDDLVGVGDHMIVGHDVAVRGQDEARPHATRLFLVRL